MPRRLVDIKHFLNIIFILNFTNLLIDGPHLDYLGSALFPTFVPSIYFAGNRDLRRSEYDLCKSVDKSVFVRVGGVFEGEGSKFKDAVCDETNSTLGNEYCDDYFLDIRNTLY